MSIPETKPTMKPTVIATEKRDDDWIVIDSGLHVGRIMKVSASNDLVWPWYIQPHMRIDGRCTGRATSFEQAKASW